MTCDEVRELLPEHLLGALEGPEDLEVRRHLRGCSTCRVNCCSDIGCIVTQGRTLDGSHALSKTPRLWPNHTVTSGNEML